MTRNALELFKGCYAKKQYMAGKQPASGKSDTSTKARLHTRLTKHELDLIRLLIERHKQTMPRKCSSALEVLYQLGQAGRVCLLRCGYRGKAVEIVFFRTCKKSRIVRLTA